MITISNLFLQFGGRVLFNGFSTGIRPQDRIGLVGRNGAGKSTLLKVLAGQVKAESGDIAMPSGFLIGYLPQEISDMHGKTVFEETATAFEQVKKYERIIDETGKELTERTDYESDSYMDLINRHNEALERFELLGGSTMEKDIELVLTGLGFSREEFNKPVEQFSGGWQMRILLAKILLQKSDLILLDEPTNHLDIDSIQWLEQFLSSYGGAVVLVSHDRAFLDNVTNRTVEIYRGELHDYPAGYSRYVSMREERREQLLNAAKNQEREIARIERNIERFRAKASKAKFAQSLIKQLDRTEKIEVEDEDTANIRFWFPEAPPSGRLALEAENLAKNYGTKQVFSGITFKVERGDRIAFVGKNGVGKTTLTKVINQQVDFEGTLRIGHNVQIGYYAQHQADSMDKKMTAFETIDNAATGDMRSKVRGLLGAFLFSGDDVYKKVGVLSGGERSRLALARLLLEPVNFLILDEPTNHLDMMSKDILKEALLKFKGTLIIVSHDREFLAGLTNRVFEFRQGEMKEHIGDINEFLEKVKVANLQLLEKKTETKAQKEQGKEDQNLNFALKKEQEKEEKKIRRAIERCEKEITDLEKEISSIEAQLQDPVFFKEVSGQASFFETYEGKKARLEGIMTEWEEFSLKLEEFLKGKG